MASAYLAEGYSNDQSAMAVEKITKKEETSCHSKSVKEILLVEDNPDDVLLIMRAIKRLPFRSRVTLLKDGGEAFDHLFTEGPSTITISGEHPDLIILDLNLPKINGLDILIRIRNDPKLIAIPICVFTSSEELDDIERCYAAGANVYMYKPFSADKYMENIQHLHMFWFSNKGLYS